jgi:hypothetical protein
MATSAFGDSFSSGRSSKAGYGTSIQSDSRGTSTKAPSAFGNGGSMSVTSQGWTSNEEEEDDGGGFMTNVEERLLKEQQKEADKAAKEEADRLKAEAEARKAEEERLRQEAAAKAASEKAAREKAAKVASDRAKGEKTTGVLEEDAPPSPSPEAAPATPAATTTPDQLRARQAAARDLRDALTIEDDAVRNERIEAARKAATDAGVTDEAFTSYAWRERNKPTQDQLTARQDAANRLKAGIRSGDSNFISAAKEDAQNAGVGLGDLTSFIARQEEELARRGEITNRVRLEGKGSGLDEYYQTQTEKSRGVPLGFSSGKGRPIAPDWRIHSRLYRRVNQAPREGKVDTRLSPQAAAMLYEQATGRKLESTSPLDYIKRQRDLAEKRQIALETGMPMPQNLYGFDERQGF